MEGFGNLIAFVIFLSICSAVYSVLKTEPTEIDTRLDGLRTELVRTVDLINGIGIEDASTGETRSEEGSTND